MQKAFRSVTDISIRSALTGSPAPWAPAARPVTPWRAICASGPDGATPSDAPLPVGGGKGISNAVGAPSPELDQALRRPDALLDPLGDGWRPRRHLLRLGELPVASSGRVDRMRRRPASRQHRVGYLNTAFSFCPTCASANWHRWSSAWRRKGWRPARKRG